MRRVIGIMEHQREMERLEREARGLGLGKDAFMQAVADEAGHEDYAKRVHAAVVIVCNLRRFNGEGRP